MNDVFRQIGLVFLSIVLFLLVVLGAGSMAVSQSEMRFQPTATELATITSTLRIIQLESEPTLENTAPPTPTGTEFATSEFMEEVTTTPTPSPTMTPSPTTFSVQCQRPSGWVLYTVKSGDNLYRIGLKFRINTFALQKANCMGNSTTIITGQKLWVPNVPTSTPDETQTPKPQPTTTKAATQPTVKPTIATKIVTTPTVTTPPTLTFTPSFTFTPTPTPTNTEVLPAPTKSEP